MKRLTLLALLAPIAALCLMGMFGGSHFNRDGNVLISDQFNNRVIEVDRDGNIVWQYGTGSSVAGPGTIVAPNDAERVGDLTLISGTGAPAGAEATCPDGCQDNRVVLVDREGHTVWQYGQTGVAGAGADQLSAPVCSVYLPNGHILITDQGNARVIEVNRDKHIVWQYGTTGVTGVGSNQLNNPNSAELLDNGDILIADESNNRVIEVTRSGAIVWQYGNPSDTTVLNAPAFASRLKNGHTVISDSLNNRIVEVDAAGTFLGAVVTSNRPGSVTNPTPTRALKLKNGDLLISDQSNHQVYQVDSVNATIFSYGQIGIAGSGANQLNAPYDAKVIGDYTGITPPTHDGS